MPTADLVDLAVERSAHSIPAPADSLPRQSSGFVHYYDEADPAKALHLLEEEMARAWRCVAACPRWTQLLLHLCSAQSSASSSGQPRRPHHESTSAQHAAAWSCAGGEERGAGGATFCSFSDCACEDSS